MSDGSTVDNVAGGRIGKRRRRLIIIVILLVALLVPLGIAGAVVWKANDLLSSIPRDPDLLPPATATAEVPVENQPITFLIAGTDTRGQERGRSDVLILGQIPADRRHIYLISLPRDLYVFIPGHGTNKINAAFSFGGMPLAVRTVEELTGTTVDHAAWIDFEGMVELSNQLGGITVWNSDSSSSGGYDFPKGRLTLQGEELLTYVRQRHGLPQGDLSRAERQRRVLKALAARLLSKENLADPAALASAFEKAAALITVDSRLTNLEMVSVAQSMALPSHDSVISFQAPIRGFGRTDAGAAIDLPDSERLDELADALQHGEVGEYLEEHPTVDSVGG